MKQRWEIQTDVATSQPPETVAAQPCQPLCSQINVASVTFYVRGTLAKNCKMAKSWLLPKKHLFWCRGKREEQRVFWRESEIYLTCMGPCCEELLISCQTKLADGGIINLCFNFASFFFFLLLWRRNITGFTSLFFLPSLFPFFFFSPFLTAFLWGMTHFWGGFLDPGAW